jgi:hypothetical protein
MLVYVVDGSNYGNCLIIIENRDVVVGTPSYSRGPSSSPETGFTDWCFSSFPRYVKANILFVEYLHIL